jgi:hypothetical protein
LLGWVLTGEEERCEACGIGKAQQKGVVKKSTHQPASKNGERMFLDICSVKTTQFPVINSIPKPYWCIIADERTQMEFSDFYSTKNEMVEPICEFFISLKMKTRLLNICDAIMEAKFTIKKENEQCQLEIKCET